jgi:alcohol dehydrogenase class IV
VVSGEYLEFNAAVWAAELAKELEIPGLAQYGVTPAHIAEIVQKSKNASSMKGNPIGLTDDELTEIMTRAL